jgi:hypothetical protein
VENGRIGKGTNQTGGSTAGWETSPTRDQTVKKRCEQKKGTRGKSGTMEVGTKEERWKWEMGSGEENGERMGGTDHPPPPYLRLTSTPQQPVRGLKILGKWKIGTC